MGVDPSPRRRWLPISQPAHPVTATGSALELPVYAGFGSPLRVLLVADTALSMPVPHARKEAERLGAMFGQKGGQITLLLGAEATYQNLARHPLPEVRHHPFCRARLVRRSDLVPDAGQRGGPAGTAAWRPDPLQAPGGTVPQLPLHLIRASGDGNRHGKSHGRDLLLQRKRLSRLRPDRRRHRRRRLPRHLPRRPDRHRRQRNRRAVVCGAPRRSRSPPPCFPRARPPPLSWSRWKVCSTVYSGPRTFVSISRNRPGIVATICQRLSKQQQWLFNSGHWSGYWRAT